MCIRHISIERCMLIACVFVPCVAVTTWLLHVWLFHAWLFYVWLFHAWHMANYTRCECFTLRENVVHANTWWGYLWISCGTTHGHASKVKSEVIIERYCMLCWPNLYPASYHLVSFPQYFPDCSLYKRKLFAVADSGGLDASPSGRVAVLATCTIKSQ